MRISIILLCVAIHIVKAAKENCKEIPPVVEIQCNTTNYEEYVECKRATLQRRKRDVNCDCEDDQSCETSCDQCDCNSCSYNTCQGSCNQCCSSCCESFQRCDTRSCCHSTCRSNCRTSRCRSSCKKSCYDDIDKQKEAEESKTSETSSGSSSQKADNLNKNDHNITTIIHLNNIINNTNIIDTPVFVNNTNFHNITLTSDVSGQGGGSGTGGQGGPGGPGGTGGSGANVNVYPTFQFPNGTTVQQKQPTTDHCCKIVGPRQCEQTGQYPYFQCYHYRTEECGPICKNSEIIHAQPRQICSSVPYQPPTCRQDIVYIPQPQPKCSYQSTWPYVSCGIQQQQQEQVNCDGCYNHYYDQGSTSHKSCNTQCYDDGFGQGSYFRQGPVYRPGYSHMPSCVQTGQCAESYGGFGGYGGYGAYGGYGGYMGGYQMSPPMYAGYPPNTYNNNMEYGQNNLLFGVNTTDPLTKEDGHDPSNSGPLVGLDIPQEEMENFRGIFNKKRSIKIEEKMEKTPIYSVGPVPYGSPFQFNPMPQFVAPDLGPIEKTQKIEMDNNEELGKNAKRHHHRHHKIHVHSKNHEYEKLIKTKTETFKNANEIEHSK